MKQPNRRILLGALAVVLAAAILLSVILLGHGRNSVYVYSFADGILGMTDFQDDGNESSGIVTTDRVQTAFLTETQKNVQVQVTEGQQVHKGDTLFTYDTTLSKIALQQKDLEVQQLKLDLETAKKELREINSYVPMVPRPELPESPAPAEPSHPLAGLDDAALADADYYVYTGSGDTANNPKLCWLRSGTMVDTALMEDLFSAAAQDVLFVRFLQTEEDQASGAVIGDFGIELMRLSTPDDPAGYTYAYSFFQPSVSELGGDSGDDMPQEDTGSGYTAAEIAKMRADKQAELQEIDFKIKVAESELSIMTKEADAGTVTADFDGVVQNIVDEDTAKAQNQPLLKVSGGGGFYVTGAVSELALGSLQLDQKVTVSSWDTGLTYEGTVVEIQQFPADSELYDTSSGLTYYPYKVFIDESADLQDGFYVSMRLQSDADETPLYLDNAFLRTDGATNYVFVRNEAGRLEKRRVQVGAGLWDTYTQILSGITADDWLAFPYGKQVREGAKTMEGTNETLYGNGMGGM